MACSRMAGKVAVVTGSTKGIGFAIANRFAKEGAAVVVSSRHQTNVDKAVEALTGDGLNVSGLVCSVAKSEDRKSLLKHVEEKHKRLDILVNCAGSNPGLGPIADCDESKWEHLFATNVISGALISAQFIPMLTKSGNGSIVMMASITGFRPWINLNTYGASKAAVISLTKGMAFELASSNIRVNCIAPGVTDTEFASVLTSPGAMRDSIFTPTNLPMMRAGTVEESANTVFFMASDEASYMTGQTVVVAGGIFTH